MCCWNENPRSFKELLCRLLYGRQQQHSLMYISHFVAITEIEMNGPCAFVSLLLDFLSWWWKGTDEVALVIRQTTDSQLLVGDPPLRWHHFVVVPLFCFVAAWLGLLDFLLLVVQTFFCLWFLFETTELWFQSATLETCSSGVRQKILYPTHNNIIYPHGLLWDLIRPTIIYWKTPSPIRLVRDIIFCYCGHHHRLDVLY